MGQFKNSELIRAFKRLTGKGDQKLEFGAYPGQGTLANAPTFGLGHAMIKMNENLELNPTSESQALSGLG